MGVRVLVLLALATAALGQRSGNSAFDLNGNRMEGAQTSRIETASGERRVVTVNSINGRPVPVESVEDRIVSKSESGQVVERTVIRYDADGNPGPPEKMRIEQAKHPGGGETVSTTLWRGDWNGNLALAERSVAEKRPDGSAETRIERPAENGSLEMVERVTLAVQDSRAEATRYRRDANGGFYAAEREVTVTTKRDGEITADTTRYRPGSTAEFEPAERMVSRTIVRPDGSKVEETDVYSKLGADVSSEPRLARQIRQEQTSGPGGAAVTVTSVRPQPGADYQKVQETTVEPLKP